MKGAIHSLESFGSVDGPGVRFVIFMQGCMMRCRYCHNADTWAASSEKWMDADEILDKAERYRSYWRNDGGITVSGGEPLLQIDFLIELFIKAKQRGINTVLDTSAQPFTRQEPFFTKFRELMRHTDLVILDLKHIDEEQHQELTGHSNRNILDCAQYLSETGTPVWIRHVLVPGVTDDDKYLHLLADFIRKLENVQKIEVLPYHSLGAYKWKELGMEYALGDVKTPTQECITNAQEILTGKK